MRITVSRLPITHSTITIILRTYITGYVASSKANRYPNVFTSSFEVPERN